MKRLILLLSSVIADTSGNAQSVLLPPYANSHQMGNYFSVYGELLGNAVIYSLNAEFISGANNFGFRAGITPFFDTRDESDPGYDDSNSQNFQILFMVNKFFGKGPNRLETGLGVLFGTEGMDFEISLPSYPCFTSTIGYRYLPDDPKKFTFKAAVTPIFSGNKMYVLPGVSFGYIFKY